MSETDANRPGMIRRMPTLIALGVLLLGLVATYFAAHHEYRNTQRRDQQHFDDLTERVRDEVTRRVMIYRHVLMGTRSAFDASQYVDRDEFIKLVASREIDTEFPGALGIGFIERVSSAPGAFDAFLQKTRSEGDPWFEVSIPPGSEPLADALTDDRYIIKYIEPRAQNREAVGLDIGAHPVRREAAERAVIEDEATLTGTIQLVQESKRMAGFLYLLPQYRGGMPLDTPAQRAEALAGWVYMPMLGPKVFQGLDAVVGHELDLHVYDGEVLVGDNMIFDADGHMDDDHADTFVEHMEAEGEFYATAAVEIGGRTWTIGFRSLPTFQYASRSGVWAVAVAGSVVSLLLALMVYMQGASTRRAWALAEGMTADLRAYADKAEQATKTKSEFLANMSHEIRTPMAAILGFTDLLKAQIDDDNDELLGHTDTIKRNGEHLLSLINDILDLSKIEAGKLDVEHIAIDPEQVVGEVLSLMNVKAQEKKLPLRARFDTPVPREVRTDPVRLRQVLVNLVGNAIKFTASGSVQIAVRYDSKMEEIKFAVIDSGIGMTDEQVTRLFQAFEQADTTTTREFGGTGLGLHISQRLAQMLKGDITCNSEFGKGSTFTLSLYIGPLEKPEMVEPGDLYGVGDRQKAKAASSSAQSAVDELIGNKPPLTGVRILLAEDGKDNQRLINHHLTKAGAKVKIVENGRLAVQELCAKRDISGPLHNPAPYDIFISDMQMPEMDGYTAARLLRDKASTLPIIALTAHAMNEDKNKCLNAGCDLFATKPIDKQKLIDVCLAAVKLPAREAKVAEKVSRL